MKVFKVDNIVIKTCFGYSMLEMEDWEMIKFLLLLDESLTDYINFQNDVKMYFLVIDYFRRF